MGCRWCDHLGSQYRGYPAKQKLELPYGWAISLLPFSAEIPAHTLIAALFPTARKWAQPSCPSTERRIRKRWYKDTVELYTTVKGNETEMLGKMSEAGKVY